MADLRDSVFLITSQDDPQRIEDGKFGTGFLIHREQEITYILTCAHVVRDVGGKEQVKVAGHKATVVALGDIKGCDLAVVSVNEKLTNHSLLTLGAVGKVGMDFDIVGSYTDKTKTYKQALIKGKLGAIESIVTPEGDRTKAWDLRINNDSTQQLQPGYSGSPVFAKDTDYVLGVVSQLTGTNQGVAISIEALKEVWPEMPQNLILPPPQPIPPSPVIPPNDEINYKRIVEGFRTGKVIPFLCAGVDLCNPLSVNPITIASKIAQELKDSDNFYSEDFIGISCLNPNQIEKCSRSIENEEVETWCRQRWHIPEKCAFFEQMKAAIIEKSTQKLSNENLLALAKINLRLLSQYYQVDNGAYFYEKIRELWDQKPKKFNIDQCNPVHRFLAQLPKMMKEMREEDSPSKLPYQLILTTSYDDELERALYHENVSFDLIYYVSDGEEFTGRFKYKVCDVSQVRTYDEFCEIEGELLLSDNNNFLKDRPVILKLYGTWTDEFVITENHYLSYLSFEHISNLLPIKLLKLLTGKNQILLLGYSPSYFDLELILQRFSAHQQEIKGDFFIVHQSKPGSLEEKLWKAKTPKPIQSTLEDFIEKLEKLAKKAKKINE